MSYAFTSTLAQFLTALLIAAPAAAVSYAFTACALAQFIAA
jgi:hypothetical protein